MGSSKNSQEGKVTVAPTSGTNQAGDEMARAVVRALANQRRPANIVKELRKRGVAPETARQLVAEATSSLEAYRNSREGRQALARQHRSRMLRGAAWTVAGLVITLITYDMASQGGAYYICWGAVLFGVIDFLAGLFGWLRYQGSA
jgi:hypothetical protein